MTPRSRADQPPGGAKRPALGFGAAVLAVLVWGTSSVLVKEVEGVNGVAIAAYRLWIGAAVLGAVFLLTGGRITRGLLRTSFWGGVAFTADIVLFFCALRETSAANATIIGALQPLLLLALAGPLFGETPRWADAGWGLVAVGGAAMVVLGGDGGGANSTTGDLLAVGALLSWTAYFVASKSARARLSSFEYLTGLSLWSAVLIVPVPFVLGQPLDEPTAAGWAFIAVVALVNGGLGHFLMNWSHNHVPLVAVSILTLGMPVVSAATAAAFIDEPLVAVQVAGMAVVVGALSVVAVHGARRTPETLTADAAATANVPEP